MNLMHLLSKANKKRRPLDSMGDKTFLCFIFIFCYVLKVLHGGIYGFKFIAALSKTKLPISG